MSRRRPGAPCDLEEIQPNAFLMHNPAIGPLLTGEGERTGDRFYLTTWRRDGLFARLRARTFVVHALTDQIAALPELPPAAPLGATHVRLVVQGERLSRFSHDPLGWEQVPLTGGGLSLREGEVIRRRRGRGPASYVQIGPGGSLQPLTEEQAVRLGYAQIAALHPQLTLQPASDSVHMSDLPLPTAYRLLLGRFATPTRTGWQIAPLGSELIGLLLGRLGVRVRLLES